MSGLTDLAALLSGLSPRLDPLTYEFVCRAPDRVTSRDLERAFATLREAEGMTLVLPLTSPDGGLEGPDAGPTMRRICLEVHSSLEAVGLTATVAKVLADQGIAANMLAGFHHDHVFVPADRADEALSLLQRLSRTG